MSTLLRGLASLLITLLLTAATITTTPGVADAAPTTVRLVADGPVETAVLLSAFAFPDGAAEVLVGTADAFPDNLAAGVLQDGRPLLLTDPGGLDQLIADEITRLGATSATVLGGEAAISPQVVTDLEDLGLVVNRQRGPTRIETAVAVAAASGATEVLLARAFPDSAGTDPSQAFADSLAAGAAAADGGTPVLLTQTEVLTASAAAHLADAGITDVAIVGGTAAISDAVAQQVAGLGITTTRIQGATRFETAVATAQARGLAPASTDTVILTEGQSGDAWVAGFTAAAHAAASGAPVLLTNGADLPQPTASLLQQVADEAPDATLVCTPSTSAAACDAAAAIIGATVMNVTLDELPLNPGDGGGGPVPPGDGGGGGGGGPIPPGDGGGGGGGGPIPPGGGDGGDPVPPPTSGTGAPDLLSAEIVGGDPTSTLLLLTFDEIIAPVDASRIFAVSPWFDGDEIGTGIAGAVAGDPTQLTVEIDADELLRSRLVTVYVADGAVQDVDGNTNTPRTAPLPDEELPQPTLTIPPDRTDAPDLVEVIFHPGATADGDGDEEVDFVFDQPINAIGSPGQFRVIASTGLGLVPQTAAQVDKITIRTGYTFGQLSDAVWDDVRRAIAEPGAVTGDDGGLPNAPIDLELGEPGDQPDLVEVTTRIDEHQVTYRFDEPVAIVNPDEFFVYDLHGATHGGGALVTGAVLTGPDEVAVSFAGGSLHEGIVGGHIRAAAVMDADGNNSRRDSQAVAATYPLGYTSGPAVQSVVRTGGGAGDPDVTLVASFDRTVMLGTEEPIAYAADGTATPLPPLACTLGPGPSHVTCTVDAADPEFQPVADATAIGLPGGVAAGLFSPENPPTTVAPGS